MATKKDQSSFTISTNLKTAMIAKGFDISPQEYQSYYDGISTEQHLLLNMRDDGSFRTIAINGGTTSFDFIDLNDSNLIRAWTVRELEILINNIEGITASYNTFNGSVYTHVIIRNNMTYNGVDSKLVDAIAKATRKVIDTI